MKELTIYLLEVLACSGVLLAAYVILLEKRIAFRWCRIYLLFTTAAAAVIPLLRIPVWPGRVLTVQPVVTAGAWDMPGEVLPDADAASALTPEAACVTAYVFGVVLVLSLMCWQIVRIRRLRRAAAITRTDRFTLVRTPQRIASFSFLHSIYLWQGVSEEELPAIVAHEASHIRHRHSIERIVMECLKALQWWNPFAWITAQRLTEAEEFEADSDVLDGGYDIETYMHVLLRQLFGYSPDIANGLRNSLTKKRFQMMTTKTPGRYALLRLAGTLPAVIGLLCAFSFTTRAATLMPPRETASGVTAADSTKQMIPFQVYINKDKRPLAGAIVRIEGTTEGTTESTTTDTKGHAELNAPAGSTISITYIGCKTEYIQVVDKGAQATILSLTPEDTADAPARPQAGQEALTDQNASREGDGIQLKIILRDKEGGLRTNNVAEGATVRFVGAERGVVADKQGIARIVAESGNILEIKYPGYATASVAVNDRKSYLIILNPEGMVSGEAPIFSRDADGVKQRPLYIVDGVEQQADPDLNANEIAGIQILKDDAATALYGERGRYGVVVVTTDRTAKLPEQQPATDTAIKATGNAIKAAGENGEEAAFLIAETMPSFRNGDLNTFRTWVQQQIRYPAEAMSMNVQGRVIITFVIEKTGAVSNLKFLASPDKLLSEEVRRIMANIPDGSWTPGKQKGKPVRVKYTLPVDFRITTPNTETKSSVSEAAPKPSANTVDEVVVVGYGTQSR